MRVPLAFAENALLSLRSEQRVGLHCPLCGASDVPSYIDWRAVGIVAVSDSCLRSAGEVVNLLLTCSTIPEFSRDALTLWNKFCIAEWMPGREVVPYLKFAPASSSACIDAIVFLLPNMSADF